MMEFEDYTKGNYLVEIYKTDAGGKYPIIGAYNPNDDFGSRWIPLSWTENGKSSFCGEHVPTLDLVPKWTPQNGEPVWASDDKKRWFPRIFKKDMYVYSDHESDEEWKYFKRWNNGAPPVI